jgi:thioredoxin-like negative regulator of GroEL
VNAEALESSSDKYNIAAFPTILFFKGGNKIDQVVGANMIKIKETVERHR